MVLEHRSIELCAGYVWRLYGPAIDVASVFSQFPWEEGCTPSRDRSCTPHKTGRLLGPGPPPPLGRGRVWSRRSGDDRSRREHVPMRRLGTYDPLTACSSSHKRSHRRNRPHDGAVTLSSAWGDTQRPLKLIRQCIWDPASTFFSDPTQRRRPKVATLLVKLYIVIGTLPPLLPFQKHGGFWTVLFYFESTQHSTTHELPRVPLYSHTVRRWAALVREEHIQPGGR